MSSFDTRAQKKMEPYPNFDNLQSYKQPNQRSKKTFCSSNKTFQKKEIAKPTTKKNLKRIREKLQTQCQERTSIKVQSSDLKVHTKKLRPLTLQSEPKITCISPSIKDEGLECLSPNSPNVLTSSFVINRHVDTAESSESPTKQSQVITCQINLDSNDCYSSMSKNKGKTRINSPDKNKHSPIKSPKA